MIYYVNFLTYGIAHSALMKLDYTNYQKPIGTILALYDEFEPSEDLNLQIKELSVNNSILQHTIHIADVVLYGDSQCLEDITPMDIALSAAKVFTPSLLAKSSLLSILNG